MVQITDETVNHNQSHLLFVFVTLASICKNQHFLKKGAIKKEMSYSPLPCLHIKQREQFVCQRALHGTPRSRPKLPRDF